ncbi:hypothetical protein DL95DRAFT_128656 [Leptodontidium sp. 2 PMI_412]|nr:hypothetical protein DL95DRAFT_128656 [Leptodontidium sp. 2 PMI_412]
MEKACRCLLVCLPNTSPVLCSDNPKTNTNKYFLISWFSIVSTAPTPSLESSEYNSDRNTNQKQMLGVERLD